MGLITYVIVGSLVLAIIGMGAGAYIDGVANGAQTVASDPFIQETTQKVQDYAIEKGSQFGKKIIQEIVDKIEVPTI